MHSWKAPYPICVILSGNYKVPVNLHYLNAFPSIDVIEVGIVKFVLIEIHPSNTPSNIVVKLLDNLYIPYNEAQSLNAFLPKKLQLSWREINPSNNVHPENAFSPIYFTKVGKTNCDKQSQSLKALSPIFIIEFDNINYPLCYLF